MDNILGEYAKMGFRLNEPDDHIVELYFKEKCIARYIQNSCSPSPELIREGCKNYTENTMRSL
jgi:hypothetical protein